MDGSRTRPVSSHEELTAPRVDQGVCVRQGHGLKTLYDALLYMLFTVCNTVVMILAFITAKNKYKMGKSRVRNILRTTPPALKIG